MKKSDQANTIKQEQNQFQGRDLPDKNERNQDDEFARVLSQVDFSRGSPVRERLRARILDKALNENDGQQQRRKWALISRESFSFIGVVIAVVFLVWAIGSLVPSQGMILPSKATATAVSVSPTPTAILPTATPMPLTTLDPTILAPDLAAALKIFPLYLGTRWVYTEVNYTQTGDPNQIISAVTSIEDQVADVQNLPPYYIAHIQRETSLVSADPGWGDNGFKTSLGSSEFWYVVHAGRVYRSNERPDPATINLDQLTEELDLPLAKNLNWCPNKMGEIAPKPQETPVPCQYVGSRVVLAEQPFQTQAGSFDACFQLEDVYNDGPIFRWFCNGVGFVTQTFDHSGSRFGNSQELVQFSVPPAFLTTTTPTAPAPALQISQQAVWGKGAISASQFSPDGQRLGVVTTQGIYIYDAASLAQLDFIPHAAALPVAAAFSPNWSLLALGDGSSVTLLRLADRAEIARLETTQGRVGLLLFSPDGKVLAGLVQPPGGEVYNQVLEVWSVPNGTELGSWGAGVSPQLAFTSDSQSLYAWYPNAMTGTQHWQIPSGKALPVLNEIFPRPVVFSLDGNLDVAAGSPGELAPMQVFGMAGGAGARTLGWGQKGFSGTLFYTPDGALLVGLETDRLGKVWQGKVWRVKDGTLLSTFDTSGTKGQLMAVSPNGQTVVFLTADGLAFYNLASGQIERRLEGYPGVIGRAAFSPQGDRVAVLLGDNDPEKTGLVVWAYPQQQNLYTRSEAAALDLAWSPGGDRLALAGWDDQIRILSAVDGSVVRTLPGHPQQVQSVAWSPDGTQIASSSFSVKLWRVSDGTLLADLGGTGQWITGLAFSPDGKLLAGADGAGKIDIWDLQAKTRVAQLPVAASGDDQGFAFTPDGKTLVAAEGADLWFYRLADFQLFLHVQGQNGAQVISLAVAPDGIWLACGLVDGTVQLRTLPGGSLLKTLDGGSDAISSLDFSRDGTTLLVASRDGTLHFYHIQK